MKRTLSTLFVAMVATSLSAQTMHCVTSTESDVWKASKVKLRSKVEFQPLLEVTGSENIVTFKRWGTCFNELGWDALQMLPEEKQQDVMARLFSPSGDLRLTMGRIPMNANDYARSWYSCDEVAGDFQLKYFNIDRDRQTIIPFIKLAQKQNPDLTFWASPWCPPSWMKINADYPVRSNKTNKMDERKDYILYEGTAGDRDDYKAPKGTFPAKLAVTDYFIMDNRYLQTYADYFGRFIDSYKAEGINIGAVMFQNEAWSYTPYPGCAWTADGIIRFNAEYLAPTLKRTHPEVDVYFGTINTNRFEVIDKVLSDPRMPATIKGVGLQWEGGQILQRLRKKYPSYRYVQTESECGWGSFDWKAAEHTFERVAHYLGNGCEDYTFWNAILADRGVSTWGWKQNALLRVDSKTQALTFTPEYYAVKHFTHYLPQGSRILAHQPLNDSKTPVLVALSPKGSYVVMAGNFNDIEKTVTVKLKDKYLTVKLAPHSMCSCF